MPMPCLCHARAISLSLHSLCGPCSSAPRISIPKSRTKQVARSRKIRATEANACSPRSLCNYVSFVMAISSREVLKWPLRNVEGYLNFMPNYKYNFMAHKQ